MANPISVARRASATSQAVRPPSSTARTRSATMSMPAGQPSSFGGRGSGSSDASLWMRAPRASANTEMRPSSAAISKAGPLGPVAGDVRGDAVLHADLRPAGRVAAAAFVLGVAGVSGVEEAADPGGFRVAEQHEHGVVPVASVVDGVRDAVGDQAGDLADRAVCKRGAQGPVRRVPAPVEGEGEGNLLAGRGDAVQFGEAGHQRFVAQDSANSSGYRLFDLVGVHGPAGWRCRRCRASPLREAVRSCQRPAPRPIHPASTRRMRGAPFLRSRRHRRLRSRGWRRRRRAKLWLPGLRRSCRWQPAMATRSMRLSFPLAGRPASGSCPGAWVARGELEVRHAREPGARANLRHLLEPGGAVICGTRELHVGIRPRREKTSGRGSKRTFSSRG